MNLVVLTGRLVRDPELRYTPAGTAVTRFTVAVDRRLSKEKKQEAESKNQPTADFIRCIAWNKTAELISNYTKKGSKIGLNGSIQTGSYQKDGHTVYTTDILVNTVEFLDSANKNNTTTENNADDFNQEGFFPIDNSDIPF